MTSWRSWIPAMLVWTALLVPMRGQSLAGSESEPAVEAAPASGFLDNAGLFQRNAAARERITSRLRQLREEYGFRMYIVVDSLLVNESAQDRAMRLQDAWVPNGDGMVLVHEVDGRSVGLGRGFEKGEEMQQVTAEVPSYETMAIFTRVSGRIDTKVSSEVFVELLTTNFADEYSDYFKRKTIPVPKERAVKLGLIIVGGAAGLGLIGLGAGWLLNRAERKGGGKRFYFPETDATERLGAPYGGGAVSSRRFGRTPAAGPP